MTDKELMIVLAPKLGMEPEELGKEAFGILISIGMGMAWSMKFHLRARSLAEEIRKEIDNG